MSFYSVSCSIAFCSASFVTVLCGVRFRVPCLVCCAALCACAPVFLLRCAVDVWAYTPTPTSTCTSSWTYMYMYISIYTYTNFHMCTYYDIYRSTCSVFAMFTRILMVFQQHTQVCGCIASGPTQAPTTVKTNCEQGQKNKIKNIYETDFMMRKAKLRKSRKASACSLTRILSLAARRTTHQESSCRNCALCRSCGQTVCPDTPVNKIRKTISSLFHSLDA